MSQVFERVIAEQQNKIDELEKLVASQSISLNTAFTKHQELFEAFGSLIHGRLPDKTDQSGFMRYQNLRAKARDLLRETGFCLGCHQFICECNDD